MTRLGSLLLFVLLCAVLEAAVDYGLVDANLVPAPSEIVRSIPALFSAEGLAGATLSTFETTFAATGLALLVGVPAGLFLASHRHYGDAYEPWLEGAFAAPIILLYPLFLIFFGRSVVTVVVMGLVVAVIPVVIKTREGVTGIPPVLRNVARSLQMTPGQAAWKVLLPAAIPSIFVGLRLALIYAMINIIAVEFLVGLDGLGSLLAEMYDRYDTASMYSVMTFTVALSTAFFLLIDQVERWLKPA